MKERSIQTSGGVRRFGLALAVALGAALGMTATAANTTWKPTGTDDWLVPANWSAGLPSVSGNLLAYIDNGGIAVLTGAAESAGVTLGYSAGKRGNLRLEGASASLSNAVNLMALGVTGTGVLTQVGGNIWSSGIRFGYYGGSKGSYDISDGTNICTADFVVGPNLGTGEVYQSGGTVEMRYQGGNARFSVGNGTYVMTGGLCHFNTNTACTIGNLVGKLGLFIVDGPAAELRLSNNVLIYIGNGTGGGCEGRLEVRQGAVNAMGGMSVGSLGTNSVVIQTGGTVTIGPDKNLAIGAVVTGTGTWSHLGGTLVLGKNPSWADRSFGIGYAGMGVFNLGDAAGCGIVTQGVAGVPLTVRQSATAVGVLRGWSNDGTGNRIFLTGSLYNSGRVIADGYGTDRALDLIGLGAIVNTYDNAVDGTNGWFAINRGELRLPSQAVSGSTTKYWGEDADLDLVNGAKLVFTGASGSLTGKLYAGNHGSVHPLGAIKAVSVHDFSVGGMTTCALTIRYDHTAAAVAGLAEANLKLYRWNGSSWAEVSSTVTTGTRTIAATGLTSLGQFVVGAMAPSGTLVVIR